LAPQRPQGLRSEEGELPGADEVGHCLVELNVVVAFDGDALLLALPRAEVGKEPDGHLATRSGGPADRSLVDVMNLDLDAGGAQTLDRRADEAGRPLGVHAELAGDVAEGRVVAVDLVV